MRLDKYIGLKFKHLGRGPEFDCLGLVIHFYKNELGVELADYSDLQYTKDWYKDYNHILDHMSEEWEVISPPSLYDVLLFKLDKSGVVVNHCSINLDDDKMLHIRDGHTSEIVRTDGFYKDRFYKAVRPKCLL